MWKDTIRSIPGGGRIAFSVAVLRNNTLDPTEFLTTHLTSNLGKENMFSYTLKTSDSLFSVTKG